jgi:hypothetical protein
MNEQDIERRIRERAHRIWEEEGRPEDMAEAHWDLARIAVSFEDAQSEMLKPAEAEKPEPIEALVNQGEFPTLTDQGESQAPAAPSGDSG